MHYRLKKVAVLGSGVMGSGIACHFANIGLDVLLLDIVPFNLSDEEKQDPVKRNSQAVNALAAAIKSKPAPLFKKEYAKRITTGNFDDDFEKVADCDWIIEVVIERLDIKKQIFEKVDRHRKEGSLVTSNTSSPSPFTCWWRGAAKISRRTSAVPTSSTHRATCASSR